MIDSVHKDLREVKALNTKIAAEVARLHKVVIELLADVRALKEENKELRTNIKTLVDNILHPNAGSEAVAANKGVTV